MVSLDISPNSVFTAAIVILLAAIYYWIKNRDVLPGPAGLPYLGLYPFLTDANAALKFEEYKMKYGDIFSFTYTGKLYINLGSLKAIREMHVNKSDCFADRSNDFSILAAMMSSGVTFVNGEPWKVLRKFFIQRFKDYGLATVRDNMAGPLYDSLNTTVEDLKASNGKPVANIIELLGKRCAVLMRRMLFGEKGVSDGELEKMITAYSGLLEGFTGVNMLLIGPLARLLFSIKPSYRRSFKSEKRMKNLIYECVKRIENSMDENHPTCIIEDFLKERNERRLNRDATWKIFSDDALVESLLQFVGDGILSVASTIAAIFNTLTVYPDQQEKVYEEIMEVIGPNREPCAEDKSNMPYTNAFISEFFRTVNFLPFFPSLECTKETFVQGYRIPVGSITLLNFYSSHMDPEIFEDPQTFNPSRYLSSPGKLKAESPIAFGVGKRSCSGEPFVMLQMFLFLTTIVKNFKVVSSNVQSASLADFFISGKLELTFVPRN